MTLPAQRTTAALSSLLIALSFWLPAASGLGTATSRPAPVQQVVSATASPIVLM
jgi:hypothetical protein